MLRLLAVAVALAGGPFDGSLTGWTRFDGDFPPARVEVVGGELQVTPERSWWVDGTRAFYLYRSASGDFAATIHVNVTGLATPMPQRDWSLSGLLLRSPKSTKQDESWVSLRVGAVGGGWFYERKTTLHSRSRLDLTEAGPGWVQLRVARVGSLFVLLTRRPDERWRLLASYPRPDLRGPLQVGIDAFSGDEDTSADLVSHVDAFHVTPLRVPARVRRSGKLTTLLPYLTR